MDTNEDEDPRGELVRPYSLTRGRTKPTRDIAIEAILVTTTSGVQEAPYAGHRKRAIAGLCRTPQSLAEVAAHLRIPLGVATVIVADMITEQMLTLHQPGHTTEGYDERMDMLERVLDGLHKL